MEKITKVNHPMILSGSDKTFYLYLFKQKFDLIVENGILSQTNAKYLRRAKSLSFIALKMGQRKDPSLRKLN